MTKAELAAVYAEHLRSAGVEAVSDSNGDLRFRRDDIFFVLIFDPEDLAYVRLVLPNFWHATDPAARREALDAINATSRSIKVAKLIMTQDGRVSAAAELFLPDAKEGPKTLDRSVAALFAAAQFFIGQIRS